MRLQNLLEGVQIKGAFHLGDLEISGVAYDSRKVKPNNLFIAIKGEKTDGNRFVDQARARGASAVISEDPAPADFSGPWIQITHSRKALAVIAGKFFGHPTGSLELVGITGRVGGELLGQRLAFRHQFIELFVERDFLGARSGRGTVRRGAPSQPGRR